MTLTQGDIVRVTAPPIGIIDTDTVGHMARVEYIDPHGHVRGVIIGPYPHVQRRWVWSADAVEYVHTPVPGLRVAETEICPPWESGTRLLVIGHPAGLNRTEYIGCEARFVRPSDTRRTAKIDVVIGDGAPVRLNYPVAALVRLNEDDLPLPPPSQEDNDMRYPEALTATLTALANVPRPATPDWKAWTLSDIRNSSCSESTGSLRLLRTGLNLTDTTPFTFPDAAPFLTPRALSWGLQHHACPTRDRQVVNMALAVLFAAKVAADASPNRPRVENAQALCRALMTDDIDAARGLGNTLYGQLPHPLDHMARTLAQRTGTLDTGSLLQLAGTSTHKTFGERFAAALTFVLGASGGRRVPIREGDVLVLDGEEYRIAADRRTLEVVPYRMPVAGEVWGWSAHPKAGLLIAPVPGSDTLQSIPLSGGPAALLGTDGLPALPPGVTEPAPPPRRGRDWVFRAASPEAFYKGR